MKRNKETALKPPEKWNNIEVPVAADYVTDLGNADTHSQYDCPEAVEPWNTADLNASTPVCQFISTVSAGGVIYFQLNLNETVTDLNVTVSASPGQAKTFYRVIEVRGQDAVIHEGGGALYVQGVVNDLKAPDTHPIDRVVVVVGAYGNKRGKGWGKRRANKRGHADFNLKVTVNNNLLKNPNANEGKSGWRFHHNSKGECGTMNRAGANVFYVNKSDEWAAAHIYQDITLPKEADGSKFVVFIGYGWFEEDINGYITNRPYLQGYEIDACGMIINDCRGQQMRHDAGQEKWQTLSGIYKLESGAQKIRFFLQQESHFDMPANGTDAVFKDLVLMIFDSKEEAEQFNQSYMLSHPETRG